MIEVHVQSKIRISTTRTQLKDAEKKKKENENTIIEKNADIHLPIQLSIKDNVIQCFLRDEVKTQGEVKKNGQFI